MKATISISKEITAYEHTCLRCGFVWRSLNERPGVCARCRSYRWETPSKRRQAAKKETTE